MSESEGFLATGAGCAVQATLLLLGGYAYAHQEGWTQLSALGSIAVLWVGTKAYFAVTAHRRWAAALREARNGPWPASFLQRAFRAFYLWDQEPPDEVRAMLWFAFLALVVGLLLLNTPGRKFGSRLAQDWAMVSLTNCVPTPGCCASGEETSWDADAMQGQCTAASWLDAISDWFPCALENERDIEFMQWACAYGMPWFYPTERSTMRLILLALVVYRLHPMFLLVFTPLPRKPLAWKNDPAFTRRIGAVIPCHLSEAEIGETVRSIIAHVPPRNVVVVDNGVSPTPLDQTMEVVRAVHADVSYVYVPRPLKTLAIWTGLQRLPAEVEFVMHVDDDTVLSDGMVLDESWFADPRVSEVAFPIYTRRVNLLTSCVGLFFKTNAHHGYFHNVTSGTSLWAAGIIGLVRREVLTGVLADHVYLPFGEDAFHGLLQLMNGYRIKRELRTHVTTYAPPVLTTLCATSERQQGYGASSLFKQRARRWTVTKLRRMLWTGSLLLCYNGGSVWHNVWFRLAYAHQMLDVTLSVYVLPLMLLRLGYDLVTHSSPFWMLVLLAIVFASSYAFELFNMLVLNFVLWRHRPVT